MTAVEIIREITLLPPTEQASVADFDEKLPREKSNRLSPEALAVMAEKMVESNDPIEQAAIKASITRGFYGE